VIFFVSCSVLYDGPPVVKDLFTPNPRQQCLGHPLEVTEAWWLSLDLLIQTRVMSSHQQNANHCFEMSKSLFCISNVEMSNVEMSATTCSSFPMFWFSYFSTFSKQEQGCQMLFIIFFFNAVWNKQSMKFQTLYFIF